MATSANYRSWDEIAAEVVEASALDEADADEQVQENQEVQAEEENEAEPCEDTKNNDSCQAGEQADLDSEDEEEQRRQAIQAYQEDQRPRQANGYEFRTGVRVQFPEIVKHADETEIGAALRVAAEHRKAGNDAYSDGSVWGAQTACDSWGRAALCLERARNLRKYAQADDSGQVCGTCENDPSEDDVKALQLTVRLNLAQGLLKLKDFQRCVAFCDLALELDQKSAKALWRKAKATWALRNPGLAREALQRLLQLEEADAAAVALLREIDAEEAKKRAKRTGKQVAKEPAGAKQTGCDDGEARSHAELPAVQSDNEQDTEPPPQRGRCGWCSKRKQKVS
eukprot:gnl/TRDRNA2_/TRDRNA2_52146_c0_seq1.p1 gnl/TRDRNA2_/TRDRNA2_52146_c0~~gnl/TRDRNA2_/TRDRNA2_52146_c0_seq1.p1  ORF type:complete len:340 (+),score=91.15 gnl/TRDRNA2_/TRDRNA2_52146_c0_seq1:65-1084(+)